MKLMILTYNMMYFNIFIPIGTESLYYDFYFILQRTIREFFHPLKATDVRIPRNAQKKPIGINMINMTYIAIVFFCFVKDIIYCFVLWEIWIEFTWTPTDILANRSVFCGIVPGFTFLFHVLDSGLIVQPLIFLFTIFQKTLEI